MNKTKDYHAVSLSGGKDSTAMLLMMLEHGMPVCRHRHGVPRNV